MWPIHFWVMNIIWNIPSFLSRHTVLFWDAWILGSAQSSGKRQSFERKRPPNQPISRFKQLPRPKWSNDASRRTTLFLFADFGFIFPPPSHFPFRVYHTLRSGPFIAGPVSRNIASTLRPSNSIWVSSVHYKYIWVSGFIWAFYYLLIIHKLRGRWGRY